MPHSELMFESLAEFIAGEWQVITRAPATFIMLFLFIAALVWAAMNWRYTGVIDSLKERVDSRDERIADYQRKLEGASPDEAKARIDALEGRLAALEPKRLTEIDIASLIQMLAVAPGSVNLTQDVAANETRQLKAGLTRAFREAGWRVQTPQVMGLGNPPPSGIRVSVLDLNRLSPQQAALISAFHSLGLVFEKVGGYDGHGSPGSVDAEILLTTPAQ